MAQIHPTKKRIRECLLDMLQTTDADKITAVDLVKRAGVSRATLYRYYDSVDDIMREMNDEFLEEIRDCSRYYISSPFDLNHLDTPYPAFVAIAEYILAHKEFFLSMSGPHGDARFIHKWHKFIQEFYFGKLAYEGLVKKDLDVYMAFVSAGNDKVIRYWLEKRPDIPVHEIVPIIQRILYGPFAC